MYSYVCKMYIMQVYTSSRDRQDIPKVHPIQREHILCRENTFYTERTHSTYPDTRIFIQRTHSIQREHILYREHIRHTRIHGGRDEGLRQEPTASCLCPARESRRPMHIAHTHIHTYRERERERERERTLCDHHQFVRNRNRQERKWTRHDMPNHHCHRDRVGGIKCRKLTSEERKTREKERDRARESM